MNEDREIVDEFVSESREHLADLEQDFLQLERGTAPEETVNRVFRAIHTIKGASSFLELASITSLSHAMEDILSRIRDGRATVGSNNIDPLLRGVDALREMLDAEHLGVETDVGPLVNELRQILEQITSGDAPHPTSIATPAASAPSPDTSAQRTSPQTDTIRVSVGLLDSLLDLAGELVLGRNQLLRSLGGSAGSGKIVSSISQRVTELHEQVMRARMRSMATVFERFPRLARDIARREGKEVEIHLSGQDVEVDRTIIEAVTDPLTHCVRNSLDHGLEVADERVRAGKERVGNIWLRASHSGGQLQIEIEDDGRGIDTERVKQKCIEKGLLTEEAASALTHQEAINLVFLPGFSTAEKVTDLSGRGVGMDVVRSSLSSIGGQVELTSTLGKGTLLTARLPLTLAIVGSFVVKVRSQVMAVPQTSVREIVRVRAGDESKKIEFVDRTAVLRFRDKLLPLVELSAILDHERTRSEAKQAPIAQLGVQELTAQVVMVIAIGNEEYGLVVDEVEDTEEVVVKPIPSYMEGIRAFSGAAILGDGRVAPTVDVAGVAALAQIKLARTHEEADLVTGSTVRDSLLVVSDGGPEQFAIPLSTLVRLERFESDRIEYAGGRRFARSRNESLPLIRMNECLPWLPKPKMPKNLHILVTRTYPRVGLLVNEVLDAVEDDVILDFTTIEAPGVTGTSTLQGRLSIVVDVEGLVEEFDRTHADLTEAAEYDLQTLMSESPPPPVPELVI